MQWCPRRSSGPHQMVPSRNPGERISRPGELTFSSRALIIRITTRCRLRWEPGRGHTEAGQRRHNLKCRDGALFCLRPTTPGDTQVTASNAYEQFVNDEEGYLRWLEEHRHGLVVNSHRVPVSSYLFLHRASCASISTANRTNWTTRDYIKTCSTDVAALAEWARQATGGKLTPCRVCKPVMTLGLEPSPPRLSPWRKAVEKAWRAVGSPTSDTAVWGHSPDITSVASVICSDRDGPSARSSSPEPEQTASTPGRDVATSSPGRPPPFPRFPTWLTFPFPTEVHGRPRNPPSSTRLPDSRNRGKINDC
jgi:hypothetical protein